MSRVTRAIQKLFRVSPKFGRIQTSEAHQAAKPIPPVPQAYGVDATDSVAAKTDLGPDFEPEVVPAESVETAQFSTAPTEANEACEEGCKGEVLKDMDQDDGEEESMEEGGVLGICTPDLASKTSLEMIIAALYVALANDDDDVTALRTREGRQFTHIVRLAYTPSATHANIRPSQWSVERFASVTSRPEELCLTCPSSVMRLNDDHTALKTKQILAAHNYIAAALPQTSDTLGQLGCVKRGCVLIVGSADRMADILVVVVCYLTSLTGVSGTRLLERLQQTKLVRPPWRSQALGEASSKFAESVARNLKS